MANDGVPNLVISHHLFLVVLKHAALFLKTSHHTLDRFAEVLLLNTFALRAGCKERRLIHQVGQVGTGETAGGLGDAVQINSFSKLHLLRIDLKNGLAAREVGPIHQNLTIETTGTQQSSIENFGLVGRREHDHRLVLGGESIHLREQLIECLLAFIVPSNNTHGAGTTFSDGIEFVNENDAGSFFLGFLEQITNASGTGTHEQLNKL